MLLKKLKHPSELIHGFAGLKGYTHGGLCGSRNCGEFVSVRDIYALANLTAHHEIAHSVGLQHADGLISFWFYNDNDEQETNENHIKPFTIMGATPPICLWSSNSSSAGCHVRLPFYADNYQFRKMYYYGWPTLRKFGPSSHVEEDIKAGMTWLSVKK